MENTHKLLMQDTALKWYIVLDSRPIGPLSAKEIVQRLRSHELNYASHVWKEGFRGWTRIFDVIDFKPLLPPEPPAGLLSEIKKNTQASPPPLTVKQKEELRYWYMHVDDSNFGPYSDQEIHSLIESGQINAGSYLWKKGFPDWKKASNIEEWASHVPAAKATEKKKRDQRQAPRKPFESKILFTDGKEVGWALCRDISIGGMQVLMDRAPAEPGTMLKMNITNHGGIPAFTCEGSIVRILEDGRGFSFRFINLSPEAKAAIEKYISQ